MTNTNDTDTLSKDEQAAEMAVPNAEAPTEDDSNPNTVAYYVKRYQAIAPKSAASIIELGETLSALEQCLGRKHWNEFYARVGLDPDGSTVRKLRVIGRASQQLKRLLPILPNNWTTIYELAKLPYERYIKVVDSGILNPFVTAKEIRQVAFPSKKTDRKPAFRVSLNLSALTDGEKKKVVKQLQDVAKLHAVKLETDRKADLDALLKEPTASEGAAA